MSKMWTANAARLASCELPGAAMGMPLRGNYRDPIEARRMKYFEEYRCGCVSESVRRKKDLLGYCAKHGEERIRIHREPPTPAGAP